MIWSVLITMLGLASASVSAQQAEEVVSAEQTFTFLSNTWQLYQRDAQIDVAIGLSDVDSARFVELVASSYRSFIDGFEPDSNFCASYTDPRNGIVEIEERASMAMVYLRSLDTRLERYTALDQEFQRALESGYGEQVLANVLRLRAVAVSFEYLPSWQMNAAEIVNFADTACR